MFEFPKNSLLRSKTSQREACAHKLERHILDIGNVRGLNQCQKAVGER
jgi:hypothetical protein